MTPPTQTPRRSPGRAAPTADPPPRRGRPPRLSRPAILAKALELIDHEGADALTMRRLGAELGVEAMSLYRHVASKRALLDGIAERMMAEVDDCQGDHRGDWADAARSLSIALRTVARAHPAAFELVGLRALNTHDSLRPIEALLAEMRAGGFTPERAVAVYRLLVSYVRGFALAEIAGLTLGGANSTGDNLTAAHLPAEEFPTIRELAGELALEATDLHFRAGLETILAGVRSELAAAAVEQATPPVNGRARARARP